MPDFRLVGTLGVALHGRIFGRRRPARCGAGTQQQAHDEQQQECNMLLRPAEAGHQWSIGIGPGSEHGGFLERGRDGGKTGLSQRSTGRKGQKSGLPKQPL